MKLSTRARYAVTAMLDIVLYAKEGHTCTLSSISQRQGISLYYLEQIFLILRRSGLVDSVRGAGGGYRLAHPASSISIAHIVEAVDCPLDVTHCHGEGNCQRGETCLTHDLWDDLGKQIRNFLGGITLASLARRKSYSVTGSFSRCLPYVQITSEG